MEAKASRACSRAGRYARPFARAHPHTFARPRFGRRSERRATRNAPDQARKAPPPGGPVAGPPSAPPPPCAPSR
ncbi:hypothetical protein DPR00_19060 [Burkholderia pseudomallei]|uniref:Uncharacterized protein n=1 Tax=Burkholderia pseudomallei TaxID=28450 RepID=A0AAX0U605_BURPE|nr:hypothetical protein BHT10_27065 [Burkholderia pseudomallei]EXI98641.1 hypothetical protein T210_0132490 [Burkholderia pseudomallei MSHR6137]PJO64008.1 hypothetical protein CWD88_22490 [Burkholderia pseudomallei]PNX05817.1 hypothetical protein CF641_18890 [Burkholderia pseudomallei]RAP85276.1 hypothetical protein DPR01_24460 [Burkholderia pseudomallei]